ncbi:hypothetical protein PAMP_010478 [Pampus punctatissimus]
METTDRATEGDPLKGGEDGVETVTAPPATELKGKSCKEVLGFSRLTHWRTAVFFFSLFLCLTIVFAFSFVIPCPVRPQYLIAWNRTFSEAVTYDFLAIEEANEDKVMDVLFVRKDTEDSQNNTCVDAGLPSPCVFMLAVDGTDGKTLWERPLNPEFHWAQCGLDEKTNRNWDCLLSHADQLSAINKHSGEVKWQQPQPTGLHSTVPVLSVPDLNTDGVSDVALVASDNTQTQLVFLSGKSGVQIGSTVILDSTETASHLLYRTAKGSHYVLFRKDTGLYALALWRIAAKAKAGFEEGLKKDELWEKNAGGTSDLIPVYVSDSVKQVLTIGEKNDASNLLLVTGDKVIILDGKSGGVLWEVNLSASPNSPRPASIYTIKSFSIFMFWGMMPSETNTTVPLTGDRRSYMLYPLYSKVLLESSNVMDHIISFKATLMERGRHAAYILLTGSATEGAEGTVVLSKRKLKQDVPLSRVLRIGTSGPETNEDIKEAFSRLRFSDL